MGQRILSYSIAISLLLVFFFALPAQAQQARPTPTPKRDQKKKSKEVAEVVPLYNGIYIGADLYGAGGKLFGSDFLSSEVGISVNLKNKFIPTVEVGYGTTDAWNDNGIHYKSSAPFFRFGIDYNTMSKKKEKNSFLYVGLRYGMSSFNYDVSSLSISDPLLGGEIGNPNFKDPIWGGESTPFRYTGLKATMQWFELVGGIKVQVYKNFYMGWALRMKYKTSVSLNEHANPWYVPGYGKFKSSNMGVTYSLIYKLPY